MTSETLFKSYSVLNLIRLRDLLGEVLVGVRHSRKASADVVHWERHLKVSLHAFRLVVWVLKVIKKLEHVIWITVRAKLLCSNQRAEVDKVIWLP